MSTIAAPLARDVKVMGLVGAAHWSSHFFQLVLPALFPILKVELGVSYVALGLVSGITYASSGFSQVACGFLVDRFGARRILLCGLTLFAVSVMAAGMITDYWMLLPLAVLMGLGNSVFHPADLTILTQKISAGRMGRAYATHALMGNLGWAAAPVLMVSLASIFDWRIALVTAGCIGLAIVAAFLLWSAELADDENRVKERAEAAPVPWRENAQLLLSPTIVSCFLYFACLAMALIGIDTFGVAALVEVYDLTLSTATLGLTVFLLCSAAGILVGGFAADRTDRHDAIAIAGMLGAGMMVAYIGTGAAPAGIVIVLMGVAGAVSGVTSPSRDMLVRKAAPSGASGRIFGFVYSGLDLGSAVMPIALGYVIEFGSPNAVFYSVSVLLLLTSLTVVQVRKRTPPRVTA
jgi:FSR family fosmidomycin resistance protein-like MFS transporter